MKKATEILCGCTNGVISKATLDVARDTALSKYKCIYAKCKVLNFTKGFLKYLTNTTFDTRFLAFELFLKMPKVLKLRKHVTSRIVTKDHAKNGLSLCFVACKPLFVGGASLQSEGPPNATPSQTKLLQQPKPTRFSTANRVR